jgi:DNA primase large subunit
MIQIDELKFASKYPFSKVAKSIVKQSGLSIDSIPNRVVERASYLVISSLHGKPYSQLVVGHSDVLKDNVLAFPVAKILVSIIDRFEVTRKFCQSFYDGVMLSLEAEPDEVLFDIAKELNVNLSISEGFYFAEVDIASYLKPEFDSASSKLVNQQVEKGRVFLSRRGFVKLLSEIIVQDLKASLPVDVSGASNDLKLAAKRIEAVYSEESRKVFSKTDFGEVNPVFFPPCISKLYSELVSGQNVNHLGRFAVATFLNQVGLPSEKIVDAFRATPNFNEHITRYQVERISGKKGNSKDGYNCPSCDKMRTYGLCVADCPVSHPVQFYEREFSKQKKK